MLTATAPADWSSSDFSRREHRPFPAPDCSRSSANGRQLPMATVRQSEADGVRAFRYCRVGTGFAYIARRPRTAEKKLAFMKVRRKGGTKPCSQRLTFILLLQFDPKGQWALTPLAKTFCGQ